MPLVGSTSANIGHYLDVVREFYRAALISGLSALIAKLIVGRNRPRVDDFPRQHGSAFGPSTGVLFDSPNRCNYLSG